MDINNCLTVENVAKRTGLTEERIRELINLKEIKATKLGRWWISAHTPKTVQLDSLESLCYN